ncbi:4a-hydroxytetrahydrobiopterin dehydratase [Piscinibacter sp. HJYY11]|uniref:4a-hydroxytetrahydrobiopterin dehydratase n=1 Tax=Piscinibacter sp. HJYY11 TaxID=2801333 RepID=UPI00191DD721|nr:4a-hydroxytetrahydrobiopterin dehydratase [Piscinibacter sp. HJYY11]MBL0730829.1 4a-hydroxytetrahydrobiopterin dehydratase [Piscinibacter sp. HJYY11]
MTHLLNRKCQPLSGAPMSEREIHDHLAQVSGWQLSNGSIEKTFSFKNYHETMAFVNALAWISHTEDHHPDLLVSYSCCVVRYNTHSVGGISVNDFICAAKADALVAFVG